MRIKPWAKMPTKWILAQPTRLDEFTWGTSGRVHGSAAVAALQLWIALITQADEDDPVEPFVRNAQVSYETLMDATGLSRKLISKGLSGLEATGLVAIGKEKRRNTYTLAGFEPGGWCKLPARALYTGGRIQSFHHFHMRSACELHALKLYLYYAAVRNNITPYSSASYETINQRAGVPERWIPKANSFLMTTGLIALVQQEKLENSQWREPNKYYLAGYKDLFVGRKAPVAA